MGAALCGDHTGNGQLHLGRCHEPACAALFQKRLQRTALQILIEHLLLQEFSPVFPRGCPVKACEVGHNGCLTRSRQRRRIGNGDRSMTKFDGTSGRKRL